MRYNSCRTTDHMFKRRILIFFITSFFAFVFFSLSVQSAKACTIERVTFSPNSGTINQDTWFNRDNYNRYLKTGTAQGAPLVNISILGSDDCKGQSFTATLAGYSRYSDDHVESFNGKKVTFLQSSKQVSLLFLAGEEVCDLALGIDCDIVLKIKTSDTTGEFYAHRLPGSDTATIGYDCDSRFTLCSSDFTFKLLEVRGGLVEGYGTASAICAYKEGAKEVCIPDTNLQASSGGCTPNFVPGSICCEVGQQPPNCRNRCITSDTSRCTGADVKSGPFACINNTCTNKIPSDFKDTIYNNQPDCEKRCSPNSSGGGDNPPADGSGSNPTSGGTKTVSGEFTLENPLGSGYDNIEDLVKGISSWIIKFSIPIAFIIILYGGIMMLTAGANPANFEKGKKALTYAVLGLSVIFIGRGFITLIQSILKLAK